MSTPRVGISRRGGDVRRLSAGSRTRVSADRGSCDPRRARRMRVVKNPREELRRADVKVSTPGSNLKLDPHRSSEMRAPRHLGVARRRPAPPATTPDSSKIYSGRTLQAPQGARALTARPIWWRHARRSSPLGLEAETSVDRTRQARRSLVVVRDRLIWRPIAIRVTRRRAEAPPALTIVGSWVWDRFTLTQLYAGAIARARSAAASWPPGPGLPCAKARCQPRLVCSHLRRTHGA